MSSSFPFAPSNFFAFRTPTLPFEFLEAWSSDLPLPADGTPEFHRRALRERLKEAVARPEIRDALFLASPDLEEMLVPWQEGRLSQDKRDRVDQSLVRYLSRMASRPTPFGLFAGCSLGSWSDSTRLETQGWRTSLRRTRLDMDYLCALVEALEKAPAVREVLRYRPNSSLYYAAGRFRYAEGRLHPEQGRKYHLVALEKSPYLEATLQRAAGGATLESLALPLVNGDITPEEAKEFIHELIDAQVLVSDLCPTVTGPEPIHGVIERLRSDPGTAAFSSQLEGVRDALQALDSGGLGQAPSRYRDLARDLESLPAKVNIKHLFQVDLAKPAPEATLSRKVRRALTEAVDLLRRLTPTTPAEPMKDFKNAFKARYEERWVPLVEVLDEETGIGLGTSNIPAAEASPLLEGLAFPMKAGGEGAPFSPRVSYLLNRLLEMGPVAEWDLTDSDLKALENPEPGDPPDSFACMASLAASSPEAMEEGNFKVLVEGYAGPSGARLLGRFCHGNPELDLRVREHLQGEADLQPGAILAEIAHLPEGRLGNILCRPLVRKYEIPFLGASGAPEAFQIPLQDLLVSIQGGRVVLRSRRLGKEVVPRLTSAHNYSRGLNIYRFLCGLQDQSGHSAGWSWGALDSLPYLPRVTRGRHVLQKAQWNVTQTEIKAMIGAPPDEAFRAFGELGVKRGLPRMVLLVEGDNELLVDLHHPLWVDTLLHLVGKRASFKLQELFPAPQELLARGPEGRFCHELVVPFLRVAPVQATGPGGPAISAEPKPSPTVPRTFLPGSEWLFLKVYTGTSTADQVILQALSPFLEAQEDLFDRWFFLRYTDPDHHLRMRFHGEPDRLAKLMTRLHDLLEPLQGAGWVWKTQLDTYERELERYGGPAGILLAEELFFHDSRAVLGLMSAYSGDEGADWRWRMGLKGVDLLLDDLGFDLETKGRIIRGAREAFSREFQSKPGLDIQLGARFRKERKNLDAFLFGEGMAAGSQPGLEILEARSRAWRPSLEALVAAETEGSLLRPRTELAMSYTHMHLNRLLRSAQRAQEFVIYDFLDRLYESRLARSRKVASVT